MRRKGIKVWRERTVRVCDKYLMNIPLKSMDSHSSMWISIIIMNSAKRNEAEYEVGKLKGSLRNNVILLP